MEGSSITDLRQRYHNEKRRNERPSRVEWREIGIKRIKAIDVEGWVASYSEIASSIIRICEDDSNNFDQHELLARVADIILLFDCPSIPEQLPIDLTSYLLNIIEVMKPINQKTSDFAYECLVMIAYHIKNHLIDAMDLNLNDMKERPLLLGYITNILNSLFWDEERKEQTAKALRRKGFDQVLIQLTHNWNELVIDKNQVIRVALLYFSEITRSELKELEDQKHRILLNFVKNEVESNLTSYRKERELLLHLMLDLKMRFNVSLYQFVNYLQPTQSTLSLLYKLVQLTEGFSLQDSMITKLVDEAIIQQQNESVVKTILKILRCNIMNESHSYHYISTELVTKRCWRNPNTNKTEDILPLLTLSTQSKEMAKLLIEILRYQGGLVILEDHLEQVKYCDELWEEMARRGASVIVLDE